MSEKELLEEIAAMEGSTLLGPTDEEFAEYSRGWGEWEMIKWAHELGANKAFRQAAALAKALLRRQAE